MQPAPWHTIKGLTGAIYRCNAVVLAFARQPEHHMDALGSGDTSMSVCACNAIDTVDPDARHVQQHSGAHNRRIFGHQRVGKDDPPSSVLVALELDRTGVV